MSLWLCQSPSPSGTLVLPRTTAPASLTRVTASASSAAIKSLCCGKPQVVGRPATLKASFTVSGRPSSGRRSPRASAASASRAAVNARSKSRTQMALILLSCRSMRSMANSVSSTDETSRSASAFAVSTAVANVHCDAAKVLLRCHGRPLVAETDGSRLTEIARARLSRQHALHDAVAIDEDVRERGADMNDDQDEQQPFGGLVQAVDGAVARRVPRGQHRQRKQIEERDAPAAEGGEQPAGGRG